ncbi:hypothetical protein [Thermoanaerobacterium sp. RBIITD]|uniref:hypothetical protein n=1 Tax=Thermoanaerobacterium sp. RBIITD TaxID=1550240 RepID=UPI000BB71AD8|nr:hypothetical protein [Thermoanaerobacterium sp. RBIITD]SNX53301.1 hypothetical protein SAMN05660242_0821 [Thermoanaerobacterium sp. RBIITD]
MHRIVKLFTTMMVIMILVTTSAFAQSTVSEKTNNSIITGEENSEIESSLKQLESKYDVTFIKTSVTGSETLKFKDVKELENFLKNFKNSQNRLVSIKLKTAGLNSTYNNEGLVSTYSTTYSDSDRITWWAPFAGGNGLACWKNVTFNYKYTFVNGNPQFVSVSNINSYVSGLVEATWHQTNSSYYIGTTDTYNDTAFIKVIGYFLFGIQVGNYPVGMVVSDTWNCSLDLD